ncbi:MAG: hypothetical protein HUJ80_04390 [Firmicutes bacterium]|nr:hypothetical protein [Bacillota bacterium]
MEPVFLDRREQERVELYCEYLKKIPELLKQLDAVELMYTKALTEEKMLTGKNDQSVSVQLYDDRLRRTASQCEARAADIKDQLALLFALKKELEETSSALRALMGEAPGR